MTTLLIVVGVLVVLAVVYRIRCSISEGGGHQQDRDIKAGTDPGRRRAGRSAAARDCSGEVRAVVPASAARPLTIATGAADSVSSRGFHRWLIRCRSSSPAASASGSRS